MPSQTIAPVRRTAPSRPALAVVPRSRPDVAPPPAVAQAADPLAVLGSDLAVPLVTGGTARYVNLDYAATAPCLAAAADAVNALLPWYASVHRGAGGPSQLCTARYEQSRRSVADFFGCRDDDVVVFCRGTTDAMNLLAHAVPPETVTVTFASEHHATLLPWGFAAPTARASRVVRLPAPDSPSAAVRAVDAALRELRRGGSTVPLLVAVTGASNVTGELWPVADLTRAAHRYGARVVLDAAQLAPHRRVDVAALDVDYVALSGHKLYAPFGAGVLAGRPDWLDAAPPYLAGGGATAAVGDATNDITWSTGPARHEAGTPNLLGAVALAAACDALSTVDHDVPVAHEEALLSRLRNGLADIPDVMELTQLGYGQPRVGIVSFVVAGLDSALVAAALSAEYGIGVRDGLFCAHPLTRRLLHHATRGRDLPPPRTAVRASLGLGTRPDDIDRFLAALTTLATKGPQWTYSERDGRLTPDPG